MFLVAEIGPANGDITYALEAVNAAKESGFTAVKGQIYDRDKLVTRDARTYAQEGIKVADTQYEDFARQLSLREWVRVADECETIGIEFFASVFDHGAVEFCETLGVKRYKIASGDITYQQLIQQVSDTGKEVVLSTGASTGLEIARALGWVSGPVTLLACTLSYPCKPRDANLARMQTLRLTAPRAAVGYSDHTFGVGAMLHARKLGADMVEKHFTITPGEGGDHDFAVTPEQMAHYWTSEPASGDQIYEGSASLYPTEAELIARYGARRSIHAAKDLPKGSMVRSEDVVMLRPAEGLDPWELDKFMGLPLRRNRAEGQPIRFEDF